MASPTLERLTFPVAGMTCQACAHSVERALRAVPGVAEARVNFGSRSAEVLRDRTLADARTLARAVSEAGYRTPDDLEGSLADQTRFGEAAESAALARARRDALLALVFGAPVVLAPWLGLDPQLALLLSAPVVFVAGAGILAAGARAASRLAPDMNTLVALGSLAAWTAAALETLRPGALPHGEHHVQASVLILAFVLVGRFIEARVRRRAGDAVKRLLELAPARVHVLRRGVETEVALAEVKRGNLVIVRPGERVPVDGTILEGRSFVDESTWTGESAPVAREAGARVRAGTLNVDGVLSIAAEGVGSESSLARVAEAVRAAQGSRAPVQELADRASRVFVPCVLAIAAVTFAVWFAIDGDGARALAHGISVLVVACPCALGLATPAAVVAAVARGAREGVLVRDAGALQKLADVGFVVFDKTGTLTRGRPTLRTIELAPGVAETADGALALAAAVEVASEQPIGRALVAAARDKSLAIASASEFRAFPGEGVEARVGGRLVFVGSREAALARAATGPASGDPSRAGDASNGKDRIERLVAPLAVRGETVAVLLADGLPVAAFGLGDEVRPTAQATIAGLRRQSVEVMIFSGDHPRAVERFADSIEVERARGGMSPKAKAESIEELTHSGRRVAMVGDGVNDAAALARADVGIALGGGADAAIEAADCTILAADPARVPLLVALGRRTLDTIHTNLTWAFGYNVIALPAAAGVLEPLVGWSPSPALSAAAMAGSSLAVVLNSLRLLSADLG